MRRFFLLTASSVLVIVGGLCLIGVAFFARVPYQFTPTQTAILVVILTVIAVYGAITFDRTSKRPRKRRPKRDHGARHETKTSVAELPGQDHVPGGVEAGQDDEAPNSPPDDLTTPRQSDLG